MEKDFELDPTKIKDIIDNNYHLIDLRLSTDFNKEHILNFINIPYDNIEQLKTINITKPIIFICYSGSISKQLSKQLNIKGYKAYSIKGGMNAVINPTDIDLY